MAILGIAGRPTVSTTLINSFISAFSDVTSGTQYINAGAWAWNNGILLGSYGQAHMGDSLQRQEAVTFLLRMQKGYSNVDNIDVSEFGDEHFSCRSNNYPVINTSNYCDWSSVPSWAESPILWGLRSHLISGSLENWHLYIHPSGTLTRAQAAQILYNMSTYWSKTAEF